LIEKFGVPLNEYPRRCEVQIENWNAIQAFLETPDSPLEVKRSHEYGSRIIHSLYSGEPRVVYSNVINNGLINNLPDYTCVEVPCLIDNNGIQPTRIGEIPPHLAALMQTNINVQHLTVEAILTGNREHIYHAAMLDPHTAAELDLEQIWNLVDELLAAHGDWIPEALRA
jgi:alpha-galactosidase